MVAAAVEPDRLIFVEECGTYTSLGPIYGYAPRGEACTCRCHGVEARKHEEGAFQHDALSGMGPSLAVEGATTARVFETYVKRRCWWQACAKARSW
jgi:hypothetical protein